MIQLTATPLSGADARFKCMDDFRLFAHGDEFDVDAFLASTTLRPDLVWRRGEQRRYVCGESLHPTSGVEFVLGKGLTVPLLEQERIALEYFASHRDELQALARLPGVDTFILGLVFQAEFERNVLGFCIGPSPVLMWQCLDVGCVPLYYVSVDRLPETDVEDT